MFHLQQATAPAAPVPEAILASVLLRLRRCKAAIRNIYQNKNSTVCEALSKFLRNNFRDYPIMAGTQLSRTSLLMIGGTETYMESDQVLKEFLLRIRESKEAGSGYIRDTNIPRRDLTKLASHFMTPSAVTLQMRVDKIVKEDPYKRIEVARILACHVRSVQEQDQQIVRANRQLAEALKISLKEMKLDSKQEHDLKETIDILNRVRSLAVSKTNEALRLSNEALVESGSPGPSTLSRMLLYDRFEAPPPSE
jgi:hypothetical protein